MIVVDASALADMLLQVPSARSVTDRLLATGQTLHSPQVIDLEILQVLRRLALQGGERAVRASEALADFGVVRIVRYGHELLRQRIWELRANVTAYDAAYLALAELLDCPLVTRDARLARVPGHRVAVEVL